MFTGWVAQEVHWPPKRGSSKYISFKHVLQGHLGNQDMVSHVLATH